MAPGTGLARATSALGLGPPLPRLHREWAHPSHVCTGIRHDRVQAGLLTAGGHRPFHAPQPQRLCCVVAAVWLSIARLHWCLLRAVCSVSTQRTPSCECAEYAQRVRRHLVLPPLLRSGLPRLLLGALLRLPARLRPRQLSCVCVCVCVYAYTCIYLNKYNIYIVHVHTYTQCDERREASAQQRYFPGARASACWRWQGRATPALGFQLFYVSK